MKLIVPTSLYLFLSVVVWGIPDAWNTNTTYNKDDVVLYTPSGTSEAKNYIALQTGAGNQPDTSTAFWSLLDSVASSFSAPPGDPTTFSTPDTSSIPNETPPESNSSSPVASGHRNASNEAFVMQQYLDFLGRDGDSDGIAFWTGELNNGTLTRADCVNSFVFSDEFQAKVAPVSRLYLAYFLRIPDTPGLEFWINEKLAGKTISEISNSFAESPEFQNTYGSLNNTDFVNLVYSNLYNRAADSAGFAYWKGQLDNGIDSRGTVMASFAEEKENLVLTESNIRVISFYYGLLRRAPKQDGYDFWLNEFQIGKSANELIEEFINSDEYQKRFN
jgi:hypothetical protein